MKIAIFRDAIHYALQQAKTDGLHIGQAVASPFFRHVKELLKIRDKSATVAGEPTTIVPLESLFDPNVAREYIDRLNISALSLATPDNDGLSRPTSNPMLKRAQENAMKYFQSHSSASSSSDHGDAWQSSTHTSLPDAYQRIASLSLTDQKPTDISTLLSRYPNSQYFLSDKIFQPQNIRVDHHPSTNTVYVTINLSDEKNPQTYIQLVLMQCKDNKFALSSCGLATSSQDAWQKLEEIQYDQPYSLQDTARLLASIFQIEQQQISNLFNQILQPADTSPLQIEFTTPRGHPDHQLFCNIRDQNGPFATLSAYPNKGAIVFSVNA